MKVQFLYYFSRLKLKLQCSKHSLNYFHDGIPKKPPKNMTGKVNIEKWEIIAPRHFQPAARRGQIAWAWLSPSGPPFRFT